ncbi:WecB/TagA/CpsF family glycosyltransferase [Sulfitobacter delicatus]|uniref:Polymer biosynthesis protein, WecB/TagA/CpsF family n=1 Tax=Sulfitobacter delicatus TaxID=218672 RepID=A0A1G7LHR6_9RHOB|nr:WecB/TagA/CpsF family glycosyltransferase [Sulfitobacter delicatus]SDF48961.1 polymer biosynthesis protein, WecB/TagA/CpsF family [Sulfitobacter delicatus]
MKFGRGDAAVVVNVPTREALFLALRDRLAAQQGFALATLNLDHLTKLPREPDFAAAYAAQDLVVADGRPVVWLSQLAGQPVELMPGSDLILPICEMAAELSVPVALYGSDADALDGAAKALVARVPGLIICHQAAPPMGFDPDSLEADAALRAIAESGARLCFLALGAPKQERLAARGRVVAPEVGFASIGAGLDFLAGRQRRAPKWMRMLALEWLWRALQSPARMVPRYARCFAILPGLTRDALRARR